eukprot:g21080.t1
MANDGPATFSPSVERPDDCDAGQRPIYMKQLRFNIGTARRVFRRSVATSKEDPLAETKEIRDLLRSPGNPSNGSAGAVKLVVTTRSGRVYDVEARQTETVLRLKSQLTGQWRLPKEIMFQALKFNGELLEEGRTLESYNIVEGSTHKLFVVPRKVVSNLKATWHEDRPLLTTGKRDWWEDAIAESDEITGPFSLDDLSANEGVETDAATAEDPDRPSMEVEKPGKGVGNMSRHIIPAGSQAGPSPAASSPFSGSDSGVESASIDDLFRQPGADLSGFDAEIEGGPSKLLEEVGESCRWLSCIYAVQLRGGARLDRLTYPLKGIPKLNGPERASEREYTRI